jgi:nucleoid-associated protein YgaU
MMRNNKAFFFLAALLVAAAFFALPASAQAASRDPHLDRAVELRGQALSAYNLGDYDRAADLARQARAELALIKNAPRPAAVAVEPPVETPPAPTPVAGEELPPLPASYTVRLVPGDRDCLSKIAGFSFVYGDPNKWVLLYRANKSTLKHPEDADIILPAEVLVIPSIAGEARAGSYEPGKQYPRFVTE